MSCSTDPTNSNSTSKKSSMTNILGILEGAFNISRKPISKLPPPLLITGANQRPGLSARMITSRIIARQSEAGAPSGAIFKNGNNVMESILSIAVDEIVNAMLFDAKIEVAASPGVQMTATGANAGGPILVQGATTNIASSIGVIR